MLAIASLLNPERALGLDPKGSHFNKRKNIDREVIVPRGKLVGVGRELGKDRGVSNQNVLCAHITMLKNKFS